MKDDERCAVARREGRYRLKDTVFRSGGFSAPKKVSTKGNAGTREVLTRCNQQGSGSSLAQG